MKLPPPCRFSIPSHVYYVIFDEKDDPIESVVILNFETGMFYSLDLVGLEFWKLAQKGFSLGDIIRCIKSLYEVDEKQLWSDIEELVLALVQAGLIIVEE